MKTIKNSKEITTLEVGDVIVFDNLEYVVDKNFKCISNSTQYYLYLSSGYNGIIFEILNLKKRDFVEKLGIDANCNIDFPETKSLEALTAIVSALFKEYEKQNELPKTWEEFCERNPIQQEEYFIGNNSDIVILHSDRKKDTKLDRNLCISKSEAEAHIALMQLRQLRKCYVGNWEPDWSEPSDKYCINFWEYKFKITTWGQISHTLSFPSRELAEQFLTNFKDLLEIAKPLL